ncbi:hypothetical protein [Anaerolentibacter hominis]|uniref:hypothetical protein n=1 Tax=Anaerolentibacter hominis TaxID=3079009 RepID=UPI0031B7F687
MKGKDRNLLYLLSSGTMVSEEHWTENIFLRKTLIWTERLLGIVLGFFLILLYISPFLKGAALEGMMHFIPRYIFPPIFLLYHIFCLYLCITGKIFCREVKGKLVLTGITAYLFLYEAMMVHRGFSADTWLFLAMLGICWFSYYAGCWICLSRQRKKRLTLISVLLWAGSLTGICMIFLLWQGNAL